MPPKKKLTAKGKKTLNSLLNRGGSIPPPKKRLDNIYGRPLTPPPRRRGRQPLQPARLPPPPPAQGNGIMGTTSTTDLMRLGRGLPRLKVLPVDRLPKKLTAGCYIINADVSSGPGSHWLGVYSGPKQEYTVIFDSFGMAPDPRILRFAKTGKKRVIGLNTQIQDVDSSNCGQYVIDFLKAMHSGTSPAKYLSQWDGQDQDKNEAKLTKKFTGKKGDGFITDTAKRLAGKAFGTADTITFANENHIPGHNWTGPGTRVKERLELLKQGKSKPVSDIDKAAFQHDLDYVKIRHRWEKGWTKERVLKWTQFADRVFIMRVKASKDDSPVIKKAVEAAFAGKRIHESIFKTPLFVKGGSKDPTDLKILESKLSFE